MVRKLDPQHELPDRRYFSKTAVPALYNREREDVQRLVSAAESYSLTSDMWSARNMQPYMSLTFHAITLEWKLESNCLQSSYFPEQHTGENLATALEGALANWDLNEENLVAMTTDNASNIKAAVERLQWPWLNCFGHNLNLAVNNSLAQHRSDRRGWSGPCPWSLSCHYYCLLSQLAQTAGPAQEATGVGSARPTPDHGKIATKIYFLACGLAIIIILFNGSYVANATLAQS